MADTSQEMLVVAKAIAAALESIALQLARLNDQMGGTPGNEIGVRVVNELRTRSS